MRFHGVCRNAVAVIQAGSTQWRDQVCHDDDRRRDTVGASMPLTPHAQLQQWLVLVLGEADGSASRAEALNLIDQRFGAALAEDDKVPVPSRPWEPKWRNRVSWQRDRMVKSGLLAPYKGPGTPWSLTTAGWTLYEELAAETVRNDPFAHFKPKSSGEYRAHVAGQTLIKQRSHEELVAAFGAWAIDRGFFASTDVHPRDLVIRRNGQEWLVEAKVVYVGNATRAVREATAQLQMYRFLLYDAPFPKMVALFSEEVGDAFVTYLESLRIGVVWRNEEDGWCFSTSVEELIARHL